MAITRENEKILAPSILSADFTRLGQDIEQVLQAGAQWIHYDVMDGMFVPNISVGLPVLKSVSAMTDAVLDVHLMIEDPDRYVEAFADAGAKVMTVHAEACRHLDRTLHHIQETGAKCAVALNPATPVSTIAHILPVVDMVLLMSVNPGFGGQSFIPYTMDKLKQLSALRMEQQFTFDIEIDGGVTTENAGVLLEAGANVLVAGSAVFGGDMQGNVKRFLEIMAS